MSLTLDGRKIDIRVVTVPLVAGESAVLRVLDPGETPMTLNELGMDDDDRERVEAALRRGHGAILATGPRARASRRRSTPASSSSARPRRRS